MYIINMKRLTDILTVIKVNGIIMIWKFQSDFEAVV